MPIIGERTRKIHQIKSGHGVRPPKLWWQEMYKQVSLSYPKFSKQRLSQIVGKIWSKYPQVTKIKIIKEYQR